MVELAADDLIVRLVVDRSLREAMIARADTPDEFVGLGPALAQLGIPNPGTPWPTFVEAVAAILSNRERLPGTIQPALKKALEVWQERARTWGKQGGSP